MLKRFLIRSRTNPVPAEPDTRTSEERRADEVADAKQALAKAIALAGQDYADRVSDAEREYVEKLARITEWYKAEELARASGSADGTLHRDENQTIPWYVLETED